jgi:hypothetical protein
MDRFSARSGSADLRSLLDVIAHSTIFVRVSAPCSPQDWATVRQSPDVDAYVLAWIVSEGRNTAPAARVLH